MKALSKISVSALAVVLAAGIFAAPTDQKQIKTLYAKLKNAMVTRNIAAIDRLEAPGFTEEEGGMKLDAAQADKMMKQEFRAIKKVKHMDMKITSLKINGKSAQVSTKYSMEATMIDPSDKKVHVLTVSGTTAETLVKTARGWLFLTEKDTGHTAMRDGKPVPGM